VSILNPLADLVAWVIIHLHTWLGTLFGPNSGLAWALSIVILVVLIRICLIPLFVKQVHAQRKMAQHAPQLAELRKKYKNDKQRLNEETMKFYKENGVNPLAGCLPMIPQMVIFFSLFYVLRAIAEWSPAHYVHGKLVAATVPKYGLSVPLLESARKATIFGVHLSDKLLFPHTPGMGLVPSLVAAVTVALSATTTFLTVRQTSKRGLMQTNVDPDNPMAGMQKYMMYIVPFFSLTGLYWQYGLVMYWLTTNLWTLGQQFFMFRNWTVEPAGAVATAPGGAYRAARSAMRPESGAAKTATGAAKAPSAAARAPSAAAKSTTSTAKTTASGTRPASAAKPAPSAGAANGRPASAAPRPKPAPESGGTSTATGRVRTGSASRDAAANTSGPPNGQNGGGKRSLLRLGRQKEEPVAEPEVPATKVVRQQPVRQAKSKRTGKR
jgi:YidC/Oxa1 family membrane protein insertase